MFGEIVKIIHDAESRNCDFVDRLNHKYMSLILVVLGVLVSTKQYVGDPIDCWTPPNFPAQWVQYTDTYCWVSNTYHLPIGIPASLTKRVTHGYEIKYYQWVPIMLVAQALMFFAPSLIWRAVSSQNLDMGNIVEATTLSDAAIRPSERDEVVKNIALQMDRFLKNRRSIN
ncbi:innexin unc-9-like [Symsagittifera roscoffensis]|uniref:innexin unc-9-like n=1 Tax=Symsagittifera roscoffensis TaxID=84072 RepID=UPI00307BBB80